MLGAETGRQLWRESFRYYKPEKGELTALLQDPPRDFEEQVRLVPRVNYTVYNENRDLFISLQRFYSSLCGKILKETERESFARFLEQNRIAAVFRVKIQNSKKLKSGDKKELVILRAVSGEARKNVLAIFGVSSSE
ncbi:MAG: hypothetical protein AAB675_05060 [Patescibacteria group bacterium]